MKSTLAYKNIGEVQKTWEAYMRGMTDVNRIVVSCPQFNCIITLTREPGKIKLVTTHL